MRNRKSVTIKDIAKRLGLSHPAVSKALTGSTKGTAAVSAATRERVRKAAREMGYRPNSVARLLRSGRSGLIGIIHHQTVDQIATRRLMGALGALQSTSFRPYIHCLDPRFEGTTADAVDAMLDARVEAVLCIMPPPQMNQAHFDTLTGAGLPVAVIGSSAAKNVRGYFDDRRLAYRTIFDHVVGLGARDVALLFGRLPGGQDSTGDSFLSQVLEGFECAGKPLRFDHCEDGVRYRSKGRRKTPAIRFFSAAPEEVDEGICRNPDIFPLYVQGYICMQRLIQSGDLPDAVVCQIDGTAFGAMRACSEHDIAMAGFGNEAPASGGLAPLTTADHPIDELSRLAVDDLCRQIQPKQRSDNENGLILRPCRLIPRFSTLGKAFG